ncbi:hypothetical protein Ate02nite_74680 [Paractinoplanes tereljensis]|uniref:VanZ-like domain-containing protein n=1 Tax=Paractinoplanes tereljensis TaxID=571912 RepID=A0A919TVF3_9ACTN|nr:hypothetical protein Ate02nite_74680 [Actinoplanes tereljensis]
MVEAALVGQTQCGRGQRGTGLLLLAVPEAHGEETTVKLSDTANFYWLQVGSAIYALGVLAVTVLPITPQEPSGPVIHYIPFLVDAPSFVLNVIMFVPFGVLVPLHRPGADAYRKILGLAVAASAAIEVTQLVLGLAGGSRRTVDVNDLIANVTGALIGLAVLRLAVPHEVHRRAFARKRQWPRPPG